MTMPKGGKAKAIKAVAAIVPVVAVTAKVKRLKPEDDAFHKVPGKAGHYRYR